MDFPTAPHSPPERSATQALPALPGWRHLRPWRVMAVDDDPLILQFLRVILTPHDCEVLTADSGQKALDAVQVLQPDLILLDVQMDGLDGHAVCRQLKADEATRDIPVIFVTALDDDAQIAEGFGLGAADYITKPLHPPVVLARVKTQLALQKHRRSLEGMFRDVIEFAPDAFVLSDAQGHIVQINARAEELFGFPRAELMGQPVGRLMPAGRLRAGKAQHRAAAAPDGGQLRMGEGIALLRKDGSEFAGDVTVGPLQTPRGPLFMALVRDATERKRQEKQLRAMTAHAEAAREEERKHIAREVHDELGQILTALRMDTSLLAMRYGDADPFLSAKVADMKMLIDRGIQGVRNVAANLRPAALDMGLVPALEWLCQDTATRTGMACVLRVDDPQLTLAPARAVVLFRIAQESITNVVRYARAQEVGVSLVQREADLLLEVSDNGVGFDVESTAARKSFGMLGMRERALSLGGAVQVRSAPGAGTTVCVTIPLADKTEATS